MRGALDQSRLDLLDAAGALLAQATQGIADAVRAAWSGGAEVLLLVFTPTVLDPTMPDARRANLPPGWAWPAFDRLQVEDYDWLTGGAEACAVRHTRRSTSGWATRSMRKTISPGSCSTRAMPKPCGRGSTPGSTRRASAGSHALSCGPRRRCRATATPGSPPLRRIRCKRSMMCPIRSRWGAMRG